ncbi:endolytic transglycosylase MltG [Bacillus marinisedimentorum]|uniref:endolytic transglycosylase MltG n=1 Tax=Bacillus marinisedimentorum TaxID=1821260 RepID=UPI000872DE91|nr:endolytic transglycosylase MltG [Bacillus marinisedimentorum]
MSESNSNQNKMNMFYKKRKEKQNEARVVRKIVLIIVTILVLAIIGTGIGGYMYVKSALEPADANDKTIKDITVPIGSSVSKIANILEENGIVKDATIFRYYVKYKNEQGFQAGDYKLSPSMEIEDIIDSLKTGKILADPIFKMTVPEGKQIPEIIEIIAKHTPYKEEEIEAKLNDEAYLKELMELYPSMLTEEILGEKIKHPLEGYLFPATYSFYEEKPKLELIIANMLDKTEAILTKYDLTVQGEEYTPHQLITMASLIEQEATKKADRKKIASVFYNRLENDIPLQTDPTVLYALGEHKQKVYKKDLQVDSPYNTYKYKDLPPGPIASPGEMSLKAALEPDDTEFLYFLATPEGEVLFNESLKEHNIDKNKHLKN